MFGWQLLMRQRSWLGKCHLLLFIRLPRLPSVFRVLRGPNLGLLRCERCAKRPQCEPHTSSPRNPRSSKLFRLCLEAPFCRPPRLAVLPEHELRATTRIHRELQVCTNSTTVVFISLFSIERRKVSFFIVLLLRFFAVFCVVIACDSQV